MAIMAMKQHIASVLAVGTLVFSPVVPARDIDIDIDIKIQEASTTQPEAGRKYRRGREYDEMVRKGYVCHREVGTTECSWEKPERSVPNPYWGECVQSDHPPKGRMCERIFPNGFGWYYDFERPLVPLAEKVEKALQADPDALKPATIKTLAAFYKVAKKVAKRLTDEQWELVVRHFGEKMDRAMEVVDNEKWEEAKAKEAARAKAAAQAKTELDLDAIIDNEKLGEAQARDSTRVKKAEPPKANPNGEVARDRSQ